MAYALPSDVSARLGRSLTTDETAQATALLSDVEILIKSKIEDLDDKVEDADYLAKVKMVEASVVARLLRNPSGYTSETDGDYTYQLNWRLASGELEITDTEWALLGVNNSMFVISPKVDVACNPAATADPNSPEYILWSMNSPMFWYGP